MVLGFKTQINEKLTHFVEKIHSGLIQTGLYKDFYIDDKYDFDVNVLAECQPKIHTMRVDKNNRWNPGVMIDFFINIRTKDMFRFAPSVPIVSIQKVEIKWIYPGKIINWLNYKYDTEVSVNIDGKFFGNAYFFQGELVSPSYTLPKLAINDGFDSVEDFFNYFNKDFTGKIIHWTNKKY